jgi:hypothetical protein
MRNDTKNLTNICVIGDDEEKKEHPGLLKTNVTHAGL